MTPHYCSPLSLLQRQYFGALKKSIIGALQCASSLLVYFLFCSIRLVTYSFWLDVHAYFCFYKVGEGLKFVLFELFWFHSYLTVYIQQTLSDCKELFLWTIIPLLTWWSWLYRRVWRWPSSTDSRIDPWCHRGRGWCRQSPEEEERRVSYQQNSGFWGPGYQVIWVWLSLIIVFPFQR